MNKSDVTAVLQANGSVLVNGVAIHLQNIHLQCIVGKGASGIVLSGHHKYLDRQVAIKLWLQLRSTDNRNKFQQGLEEARKTANAASSNVIAILDAGEIAGIFYTLMEYYPGVTLKHWLNHGCPKLSARWNLARSLLWVVYVTTKNSTYHGDLHTGNVLVNAPADWISVAKNREFAPNFKVIDFGTSVFSTHEHSLNRHWRVVTETLSQLMYPLNITTLAAHKKPRDVTNTDEMYTWCEDFIDSVPNWLAFAGVDWLRPLIPGVHVPSIPAPVAVELKRLVSSGKLSLTPAIVGRHNEWYI